MTYKYNYNEDFLYSNDMDEALRYPLMNQILSKVNLDESNNSNCSELQQINRYNSSEENCDENLPCINPNYIFASDEHPDNTPPVKVERIQDDYQNNYSLSYSDNFSNSVSTEEYNRLLLVPNESNDAVFDQFQSLSLDPSDGQDQTLPSDRLHAPQQARKNRRQSTSHDHSYSTDDSSLFGDCASSRGHLTPYSRDCSPSPGSPYYHELQPSTSYGIGGMSRGDSPLYNTNHLPNNLSPASSSYLSPSYSNNLSPAFRNSPSPFSDEEYSPSIGPSTSSGRKVRTLSTASSVSSNYIRAPRQSLKHYSKDEKRDRIKYQNNEASSRYRQKKAMKKGELLTRVSELESELSSKREKKQKLLAKSNILSQVNAMLANRF